MIWIAVASRIGTDVSRPVRRTCCNSSIFTVSPVGRRQSHAPTFGILVALDKTLQCRSEVVDYMRIVIMSQMDPKYKLILS